MPTDFREQTRLIQTGLDKLGCSPDAIDGRWDLRTARAMKALLAAKTSRTRSFVTRQASFAPFSAQVRGCSRSA